MSGHSKWSQIKHQKAAEDAKRGKIFSKLAQEITAAAKSNPDTEANMTLKALIDKARAVNMPKENIERAIQRAKGGAAPSGEEMVLEAYANGGEGLVIYGMTDNKNRTLGEIRLILTRHNAKLVGPGAVSWNFDGDTPKTTRPASPDVAALLEELQSHPEVTKVLTDAV